MRIIELNVERCTDCPFRQWNGSVDEYECTKTGEIQMVLDRVDQFIPNYCPLTIVGELQKAKPIQGAV